MNPPISLVMRIIILFDQKMEFSLCLIGPKNSHLKLNWMAIYSLFSLALKRWRGHWLEQGIAKLSLDKGNKLKEGHGGFTKREGIVCMWKGRKEEEEVWGRMFSPYVWRGVHGKGMCKNQTWKEVVCNKYL